MNFNRHSCLKGFFLTRRKFALLVLPFFWKFKLLIKWPNSDLFRPFQGKCFNLSNSHSIVLLKFLVWRKHLHRKVFITCFCRFLFHINCFWKFLAFSLEFAKVPIIIENFKVSKVTTIFGTKYHAFLLFHFPCPDRFFFKIDCCQKIHETERGNLTLFLCRIDSFHLFLLRCSQI